MQRTETDKYIKNEFYTADEIFRGDARCRVEAETMLPDYKESIGRILYTAAQVRIMRREAYKQGETVICPVSGECVFTTVYFTENGSADISSYIYTVPFEHTFKGGNDISSYDTDKMYIVTEARSENVSCRLLGPRKMVFKADAVIDAAIKANRRILYYGESSFPGYYAKTECIRSSYMYTSAETDGVISERIQLPKEYLPIGEILDCRVQLAASRAFAEDDRITVEAQAELFCLYYPDSADEHLPVSFRQPIDLSVSVTLDGCDEKDVCEAYLNCLGVKNMLDLDEYGECRVINTEIGYYVNTRVIKSGEVFCVSDCYSSECILEANDKNIVTDVALSSFNTEEEIILELTPKKEGFTDPGGAYTESEIKNCYTENGELFADMTFFVKYFGFNNEGEGIYDEEKCEYKARIAFPKELSDALSDEKRDIKIEMSSVVWGADISAENEKITVRAQTVFFVSVCEKNESTVVSLISSLGERTDTGKGKRIVFYYPSSSETLWDVAKKYAVGCAALREMNPSISEGAPLPRVINIM
ncbi:MAG: hypothetical protein E7665_08115 [Ruminococcaceae bacterium]|nr:hypothetical protein [Oscillospiraceae bacterium]